MKGLFPFQRKAWRLTRKRRKEKERGQHRLAAAALKMARQLELHGQCEL